MTVIAHFMRYYAPYEHECDSVDEAFRFLARGEDAGTLASVKVVDGETVYERDTYEFEHRLAEAWEALALAVTRPRGIPRSSELASCASRVTRTDEPAARCVGRSTRRTS